MKIIDISLSIPDESIVWPGDPSVEVKKVCSIERGDTCNISSIMMGAHIGTHIDAPNHFINDGKTTDMIPLEKLMGKCLVVEVTNVDVVTKVDLEKLDLSSYSKVLLKTDNSLEWKKGSKKFNKDFVGLDYSGAQYLLEQNIFLIGIDYLSIEPYESADNLVHKLLLDKEVIILEGINLAEVSSGEYDLICLPLKLNKADGAPARAILRQN